MCACGGQAAARSRPDESRDETADGAAQACASPARGAGDTRQFLRRCTVISPYYISPPLSQRDRCKRTHAVASRRVRQPPAQRTVTDRAHGSLLYIFGSYLVRYSTYMPRRKYGLYATAVGVARRSSRLHRPQYVRTQNLMRSATVQSRDCGAVVLPLITWARAWTNDWHTCPCPYLGSSPNRIARRRRGTRCASQ